MNDHANTDFVVFYAWQDDLPSTTNKNLIRYALRKASSILENDLSAINLRVEIDEATRGTSGSPNIPGIILDKIDAADAFVGDLTTITGDGTKKLPNPNVVFELGYAVSRLGWNRIIMLFNNAFGQFPDDMPFDFDRHRASLYSVSEPRKKPIKSEMEEMQKQLVAMLCTAIKAIIENDPAKPFNFQHMTEDQIKRKRDSEKLKWLMSNINLSVIDQHIDELPHKLYSRVLHFWEDFKSVVTSSYFSLYDQHALNLINDVKDAWEHTLDYMHRYYPVDDGDVAFFSSKSDIYSTTKQKDWDAVARHRNKLEKAYKLLLQHIRENYIEIDIDELSSIAWKNYVDHKKELVRKLCE